MKKNQKQRGFSPAALIVVLAVGLALFFGFKFFMSAQEDSQKQGDALTGAFGVGEEDKDGPSDLEIPDSPSIAEERPIKGVDVFVEVLTVTLTASLPGTYTGSCRAEVEKPNGEDFRRYVEEVKNSSTCNIYIPRNKLEGSTIWNYKMDFVTKDGSIRGEAKPGKINL